MDRCRLVELSAGGRPNTVLDIETGVYFTKVRNTFEVIPGAKQKQSSGSQRRWGGSRQVGETQENGQVRAQWLISGATADATIANAAALVDQIDSASPGRLLEWRPDGATYSTFFDLRGTGQWAPKYQWSTFAGARSMLFDIVMDVAPLALALPLDIWDDFAVDSLADYTFDANPDTLSVTGGTLAPTDTTDKRFRHTARGHTYSDVQVTTKFRFPSGFTTPFVMPMIRWIDNSNFLYGGYDYDGTTERLYIVKRLGGTPATLTNATLSPGLNYDLDYWVVFRGEGNVLTVEFWTAAPTPMGTPAQTLTHTLTGSDVTSFGADVAGGVGLWTKPGGTAWRYDDLKVEAFTYRNRTLPDTISLRRAIPGDAPALADLHVTPSGGASPPVFALVAWTARPAAGLAAVPFGVVEAETATDLSGWAATADAAYRAGNGIKVTTAGAGTAGASFTVDPNVLTADDFTLGDLDLEIWAVVELASTLVSPILVLSAMPDTATVAAGVVTSNFGGRRYAAEHGTAGKLLTLPSAGTVKRPVRVGTLPLVVDRNRPKAWKVRLEGSWAAGSSGTFGVDYLIAVMARRRAASPTSKALDATYPRFVASTSQTTKTIRSDLSGLAASPPSNPHPDSGLGGELLEIDPGRYGDVDLFVKLSSLAPDDPTSNATTEQLAHSATVHLAVWPRYKFARSA